MSSAYSFIFADAVPEEPTRLPGHTGLSVQLLVPPLASPRHATQRATPPERHQPGPDGVRRNRHVPLHLNVSRRPKMAAPHCRHRRKRWNGTVVDACHCQSLPHGGDLGGEWKKGKLI